MILMMILMRWDLATSVAGINECLKLELSWYGQSTVSSNASGSCVQV